jgi:hypothetical protein
MPVSIQSLTLNERLLAHILQATKTGSQAILVSSLLRAQKQSVRLSTFASHLVKKEPISWNEVMKDSHVRLGTYV